LYQLLAFIRLAFIMEQASIKVQASIMEQASSFGPRSMSFSLLVQAYRQMEQE
jgi:hypothetical protein